MSLKLFINLVLEKVYSNKVKLLSEIVSLRQFSFLYTKFIKSYCRRTVTFQCETVQNTARVQEKSEHFPNSESPDSFFNDQLSRCHKFEDANSSHDR